MHIHDILAWHWAVWMFFIVFWLAFIFGIMALVRWFNSKSQFKKSSLESLQERYAKGKISKENFEKMKEEIMREKD